MEDTHDYIVAKWLANFPAERICLVLRQHWRKITLYIKENAHMSHPPLSACDVRKCANFSVRTG